MYSVAPDGRLIVRIYLRPMILTLLYRYTLVNK